MSLARAFTVRRNKPVEEPKRAPYVGRAASQRAPNAKPIERSQISLPVSLISTTNMLSYEAPDIQGTIRIGNTIREIPSSRSISGSSSSGDESERSRGSDRSSTSGRSDSQDTDATSMDGESPILPESDHITCFFKSTGSANSATHTRTESTASSQPMDSPLIPQRAPSHSMKAHVLSHKRSVQRMGGPPSPRKDTFQVPEVSRPSTAPSSHPFGKELEQLNEAAEEFGHAVRDAEAEADMHIMNSKGLVRFCAADYMQELSGFYNTAFAEDLAVAPAMAWI